MKIKQDKLNDYKGITLIALVITIVVLLILAGVSINLVLGNNGLINKSKEAVLEYGEAKTNEEREFNSAVDWIDQITGKTPDSAPSTVEEAKTKGTKFDNNKKITDIYGNIVVVPEGFKIAQDSAIDVTGGVVIEDVSHGATAGSQFVWIPVGNVYTDEARTEENKKTIKLSRYLFGPNGEIIDEEDNVIDELYVEEKNETGIGLSGNATATDIDKFKLSASSEKNGGYYIGRYEARVENSSLDISMVEDYYAPSDNWTGYQGGLLVEKPDKQVFNYITQKKGAELSKQMYDSQYFTSDLMNSYAWDTAILFLQTFDDRIDGTKPYSWQSSRNSETIANQGTVNLETAQQDKICNIWDMASNAIEFTTETRKDGQISLVGGYYCSTSNMPGVRTGADMREVDDFFSFRPIIYLESD